MTAGRLYLALALLAILAAVGAQGCDSGPAQPEVSPPPTVQVNGGPVDGMVTRAVPGISDDTVLFGQSAAFSGPAQELGTNMHLGIRAAFHERNLAGGVHGRHTRVDLTR